MNKHTLMTLSGIILASSLWSCDGMSTHRYLGTMAGAEIGGTIGEAIGWIHQPPRRTRQSYDGLYHRNGGRCCHWP